MVNLFLNDDYGTVQVINESLIRRISMASEAMRTIIKMIETLPVQAQNLVVEHLREYIEDLRDELRWEVSFTRTQANLLMAARQARKGITEGLATPLETDKL